MPRRYKTFSWLSVVISLRRYFHSFRNFTISVDDWVNDIDHTKPSLIRNFSTSTFALCRWAPWAPVMNAFNQLIHKLGKWVNELLAMWMVELRFSSTGFSIIANSRVNETASMSSERTQIFIHFSAFYFIAHFSRDFYRHCNRIWVSFWFSKTTFLKRKINCGSPGLMTRRYAVQYSNI